MSTIMAFTAQQMAKLSGISDRMLRYWEQTGAYHPKHLHVREHGPFRRIYTFTDLVTLRTLATLRKDFNVDLEELRVADTYLRTFSDSPWTKLTIRVLDRSVVFRDPETGEWSRADGSGQRAMELDLIKIRRDSENAARALMQRSKSDYGKITRNRYVMSNAWVLAGTRIPVSSVVDLHNAGFTDATILREYPTLRQPDIDAAIAFVPPAKAA